MIFKHCDLQENMMYIQMIFSPLLKCEMRNKLVKRQRFCVCVYVKVYVGGDKKRGATASSCRRNGSPWLLPSLVTKRYDLWPALPWEHQLKSAPHILGAPLETSATSSSRRRSGSRRSSSWVAWETIQFVSLALWVWSSRSSLNS